jgi:hypothetical protein
LISTSKSFLHGLIVFESGGIRTDSLLPCPVSVLSIDTSEALQLPGVEGWFDQYDLAAREKPAVDWKEKLSAGMMMMMMI